MPRETTSPHPPRAVAEALEAAKGGPILECQRCGQLATQAAKHAPMGFTCPAGAGDFREVTFPAALLAAAERWRARQAARGAA